MVSSSPPDGRSSENQGKQGDQLGWSAKFAEIPRDILQPFSLAAVAVVGAILLGVFGSTWAAIAAMIAAVALGRPTRLP